MSTSDESDAYQTYLLRLWRVRCRGQARWRATLMNSRTKERQSFASLAKCFEFLTAQCGELLPSAPESDESDEVEGG